MKSKKLKICIVKNYGYTEEIYEDSQDFNYFMKNFVKTFNTEKQELVKNNLAELENIYINNYACFSGFFDSLFYDFFHNNKHYQQARKMLLLEDLNKLKKAFARLGIL